MSFGPLAFLNPWLLAALVTLPIIYWLLRAVPPRPTAIEFPPTRILVGLENEEKTADKTPWWLTLIRLLAATLVILALAEPVLNPTKSTALKGAGPVVIFTDNGWAAASRWPERARMIERLIGEAESAQRAVVVLGTASASKSVAVKIEAPADARNTAAALKPEAFAPDRDEAVTALEAGLASAKAASPSIVWLHDGVDHTNKAEAIADRLAKLAGDGSFAVVDETAGAQAVGLAARLGEKGKLEALVLSPGGTAREGAVYAFSARGERLGEATYKLAAGATASEIGFDLPLELRNQVARIEIPTERSAGAVSLIDSATQWHRVGLISGENREQAQPLLAPLYYIQRALTPYAELAVAKDSNLVQGLDGVLRQNVSVMMLADIGTLTGEAAKQIEEFVKRGGVLVRFAGPRLEKSGDDLLPVALRAGGRSMGGALSWSSPQPLAAFDETSPFAGLTIPADVTINRQVLADPAQLNPEVEIWARLKDGTPLVTATKRGNGRLVLFHITANSDWSNLPISGLFVEMLRRLSTMGSIGASGGGSSSAAAEGSGTADAQNILPPIKTLDGAGALKAPPPTAEPIKASALAQTVPSRLHPPGYYGGSASPRALNVLTPKSTLTPFPALGAGTQRLNYENATSTLLKPWMLALGLGLLFADIIAILILQAGGLKALTVRRGPAGAAVLALALMSTTVVTAPDVRAQVKGMENEGDIRDGEILTRPKSRATPTEAAKPNSGNSSAGGPNSGNPATADKAAIDSTSKVTFGYVLSGDRETDEASRTGLIGLAKVLESRTAVEPGEPAGVDISKDEIAFFPILYWPVVENAEALPDAAIARIDAYMKEGGLIVFDTRDYGQGGSNTLPMAGKGGNALQRLLSKLDVPRLEPVPENHVVTKSFYLLRSFPGRWDGGQLWVEAISANPNESNRARVADGVTSIMITSNDFAAAWALDERGRPIYPVVPGGEMQREMAYRSGVNIVMHALTGNYKADQVHVPALLERLGQ
jgi:Domain of unknown function (DUF4159)/Aerotolerance regulator N-terminal